MAQVGPLGEDTLDTECLQSMYLCALAFISDVYTLWLLHAGCLGQFWAGCGTWPYFWSPVYMSIVCVISQAKKKKKRQRIKEPPWISINTFTVIKHSSEIQLQSGRQFPLQSYVLLRASMGLGLTLIFLWLVRSGVCYSCKYFCVCEPLSRAAPDKPRCSV